MDLDAFKSVDGANALAQGYLPELIGIHFSEIDPGQVTAELEVTRHHLAPNDFLHAATIIALADSAAGYGCAASLPEGATGFTTVELKCNFPGDGSRRGHPRRGDAGARRAQHPSVGCRCDRR